MSDSAADPPDSQSSSGRYTLVATVMAFVVSIPIVIVLLRLSVRLGSLGDLLAIGLPLVGLAVLCLGLAVAVLRFWRTAAALGVLAMCCGLAVLAPRAPTDVGAPADPVRVVAANVLFENRTMGQAVRDVTAQDAAVVVISELTRPADRRLSERYEYSETLWGASFGQGVYSHYPLQLLGHPDGLGGQAIKVRVRAPKEFIVYAVHLPRPVVTFTGAGGTVSFAGHRRFVRTLDELTDAETEPTAIVGDLNLSDRTQAYGRLTDGRIDAGRVGQWADSTFFRSSLWTWVQLRIDYIVVSDDWCGDGSESFTITGSDHRGVATNLGACQSAMP